MRTLLAILTSSLLIIVAGIPDAEIRLYLALLGVAAVWATWALGERERRAEQTEERRAMALHVRALLLKPDQPQTPPDPKTD